MVKIMNAPKAKTYGILCHINFPENINRYDKLEMLQKLYDNFAIIVKTVKGNGVVVFVPKDQEDRVEIVMNFLHENNCRSNCQEIYKDADGKKFLFDLVVSNLIAEQRAIQKKWDNSVLFGIRPVKFKNHLKEIYALQNKAKFYETFLNFKSEKFHTSIQKSINEVQDAIKAVSF